MDEYIWITESTAKMIHDDQISEHGGSFGIRDSGLLSSALVRPQNLSAYSGASLIHLAARLAYGIVKNHPFVDGNKRTAFQVMYVFLKVNHKTLEVPEPEVVLTMTNLASGMIQEEDLVTWLEQYIV